MVRGEGLPPWTITVADFLGWQEPGLVIVATTVIVILLGINLIVWLIVDAPDLVNEKVKKAEGASKLFWAFLLIVAALVAIVLSIAVGIWGILGTIWLATMFKAWWKS